MKFQEALLAVKEFCQTNQELFSEVEVHSAFRNDRPVIGNWSDMKNIGMLVTGDGIGSNSGIYFFSSLDGEILYIGKATKNNLHHRVWDHMKTPVILEDGRRTFPKHGFFQGGELAQVKQVADGQIHLDVIKISEPELVSLVEVYLHTLHQKRHGRLPLFNRQIG